MLNSGPKRHVGKRVVVIGTSGCGKTTFARKLASKIGAAYIELDRLHWEPDWTEAPNDVFRHRIAAELGQANWVVDGNYGKVRDLVWSQADTIVWLDYSWIVVMVRLFWRTMSRLIKQEELWSGNRETWRTQFLSHDSLFLCALRTFPKHRREYPLLFTREEFKHLSVIRLRSPKEGEAWLSRIC